MRKTFLLLLLVLPRLDTEAGTLKLGPRHRDESNGYQLRIPAKWMQVPTKIKDIVLVGKWVAPRAGKGVSAASLLTLRFFKPKRAADDATPADASKGGIPGAAGMVRFQEKDVWDYIQKHYGYLGKLKVVEEHPDLKMSRSKTHKAHLKVLKSKLAGSGRRAERWQVMFVAAQIESREPSEFSYGVIFATTAADEKNMLRPMKTMVKRFRILSPDDEEDGDDITDADLFVDSEKKPEIWRAARKKKIGNLKNWGAIDTKNYLIVYNKDVKKRLLKQIAKHIEAIREQVYEKLFPPSREIKAISIVRVCKDIAEYHRYGGPAGSAGYWSRGDEELVVPAGMADSLRVLYHEAFHQYIHYAVGDVSPHPWFNEGHGDYFAGFNYRGKKFKSDVFKWRTGIITNALSTKSYVPLRKFLKYTQGEYYATAGLCYAQGWSFVYFLREIERRKIKKYEKYWGLLDRYFDAIKANVKSVKEQAFEGLEPEPKPEKKEEKQEQAEPEEQEPPAPVGLPRLPGLEKPFPGENPGAGKGVDPNANRKSGETKTVAAPKITGVKSALDVAVDQAFSKIDIEQLERDWVEWSK